MGTSESVSDIASPATPPDMDMNRQRMNYLQSLGIGKDKNALPRLGLNGTAEAPDRLQHDEPEQDDDEQPGPRDRAWTMDMLNLKSQDDIRLQYLRKLSYSKVWVPQAERPPKHQTVIIFDWDDTLLCTSYLNLRQDAPLNPMVARHLKDIEQAGKRLLQLAMRLGHTFIVTNAMNGWVEYSSAKYVPELLPVLEKVKVISARTNYEPQFPGEVNRWKVEAFLEVQRQLDSQIITNLISLGDSNFEMDAVHVMGQEFAQALVKTIKFRENPLPEELLKQLELVHQKFERIVENARNLKIGLERRRIGGPQQN